MQNNLKKGSDKDKKRKQQNLGKKTGKKKSKSLYIKSFQENINKYYKL